MRKVKLIVHETYQGKRKSEDVFAAGGRQGTVVCLTYGSADNYAVNGIPSKITYENGTSVKQTIFALVKELVIQYIITIMPTINYCE